MIEVLIEFYDRITRLKVSDVKLSLPENIVFDAAGSSDIDEINSFMFGLTDQMKEYLIQSYPELQEKFDQYEYDFIGRHGLGSEYD